MSEDNNTSFNDKSQNFVEWLNSKGAVLSPKIALVDCRDQNQGRAVVAISPIDEDEVVFSIHPNLRLSSDTSNLKTLLPGDTFTKLETWPALILTMMYESRSASPWRPYFDVLPSTFDSLMFWDDAELKELQGSAVVDKIGRQEAEALYRHTLLPVIEAHSQIFGDADTSVEAFHRLGSIIMSYSFDLEKSKSDMDVDSNPDEELHIDSDDGDSDDEEANHFKAMVAFADMLNADADLNNCRLHYKPPNFVEMIAIKPIAAGDQLYNDYGPLPRSDLLRRYGYIADSYEKYDVVEIGSDLVVRVVAGELSKEDVDERIDYLMEEGILEDAFDIEHAGTIPSELLITLQLLEVPRDTFLAYKAAEKTPKHKKDATGKQLILELIKQRSAMYNTTLEEDERILSSPEGLSRRLLIAVKIRCGEKQILRRMGQLAERWGDDQDQNPNNKRKLEMSANGTASVKDKKTRTL